MRPDVRAGIPVACYLRPEEAVVRFWPRPELDELMRWCTSREHTAVRLVTGDGGAGKTRLALELAKKLAAGGWELLSVGRGYERDVVADVQEFDQPHLLVVDYAETRSDLAGLLDDVARDRDGPDLRVLLLARSAGEWWQQLLASVEYRSATLAEAAIPVMLGPVPAAGRARELFDDALAAFAEKLGEERPEAQLMLDDPAPVVLVVHTAALLAVIDHATGASPRQHAASGSEVLAGLLGHEARYWAKSANGRGLDLDLSVLRLAVATGSLIGADSETATAALLSRVPDLDSAERRGRVARWLRDLYPPTRNDDVSNGEWLGALRPDRLAEQLVTSELAQRPDLIPRLFTDLAEDRASRALTVLARAARNHDQAVALLRQALAADLDRLSVVAVSVSVKTNPVVGDLLGQVMSGQSVSPGTLGRIVAACPDPSIAAAAPAAVALKRLADDSTDEGERAGLLRHLSSRLAALGRGGEALAAIEEAADIYHGLAQTRPDAFLSNLAGALSDQSEYLYRRNRVEEALDVAEQAVAIRRGLAQARPEAFMADLAASLNNQSGALSALGRWEEALAAITEAAGIYRRVALARPDALLPDLATSLNNQSNRLSALGRWEEALAAAEEAVGIYRRLARAHPDGFLPYLATSLTDQSSRLHTLGRWEEALVAIEEAVAIRRGLARARPDVFLPYLAASLREQSIRLNVLRRWEAALAAVEEAVGIFRGLVEAWPDGFLVNLAGSLNEQSNCLFVLERWGEALAAIEEAVAIRRRLAQARPEAALPELALSLNNQSNCMFALGRKSDALAAIEEATGIYRRLAEARPDTFLPYLAGSLNNHSLRLVVLGRREEALTMNEQALAIRRELAQARPEAFMADLATSLNNQSLRLADLRRWEEALVPIREAVAIRRQLAQTRPTVFLPVFAETLDNLAMILTGLCRITHADYARKEAQSIRRAYMQGAPTE